jgi:hypothetical protein
MEGSGFPVERYRDRFWHCVGMGPTITYMELTIRRQVGMRARTDFRVTARWGEKRLSCRGIEVSPSGIVLDSGLGRFGTPLWIWLELELPERLRAMRALARPVWTTGSQLALRFVRISDADRLSLAEHIDLLARRGVPLN